MQTKRKSIEERFWTKVQKADGCWLWTASVHGTKGYGQINSGGRGRPLQAHRVSWEIHFGPIPDGMIICHHCDNPLCVRPDHLFVGTKSDNALDAVRKGIFGDHWPKGERHYKTRLTNADALHIRALHAAGANYGELASRYGISNSSISKLVRRVTWRHLD